MQQPKPHHFLINPLLKYAQPVYLHQEYGTVQHIQVRKRRVFSSEIIITDHLLYWVKMVS